VAVVVEPLDVDIRRAGAADVESVREVLEEAAAWLLARGIEQWPARVPDAMFRPSIDAGETWLAERDGVAVATITLQWSDELFWGVQPPVAGYVHRVAVRRAAAGVGRRLLTWADEMAAAAGRAYLRLDCSSGNERLRAYYEDAGFTYCGDTAEATWTVSRYERQVGQVGQVG
jgi:GNAT superfamily N-acetyltransferase